MGAAHPARGEGKKMYIEFLLDSVEEEQACAEYYGETSFVKSDSEGWTGFYVSVPLSKVTAVPKWDGYIRLSEEERAPGSMARLNHRLEDAIRSVLYNPEHYE
jgi:hypothetical protein